MKPDEISDLPEDVTSKIAFLGGEIRQMRERGLLSADDMEACQRKLRDSIVTMIEAMVKEGLLPNEAQERHWLDTTFYGIGVTLWVLTTAWVLMDGWHPLSTLSLVLVGMMGADGIIRATRRFIRG